MRLDVRVAARDRLAILLRRVRWTVVTSTLAYGLGSEVVGERLELSTLVLISETFDRPVVVLSEMGCVWACLVDSSC